jgi:hypothetical protein
MEPLWHLPWGTPTEVIDLTSGRLSALPRRSTPGGRERSSQVRELCPVIDISQESDSDRKGHSEPTPFTFNRSEFPFHFLAPSPTSSEDSALAKRLFEEESRLLREEAMRKQEDERLALALARLQEEDAPKVHDVACSSQPCNNGIKDDLNAESIVRLYAGDEQSPVNIHEVFCHFDKAYFFGRLSYVVVKWSYQMKLYVHIR